MSVTPATLTPYRSIVDALLILIRGNDVLLAQRQGTGYADGDWNLPSGKLEDGETVLQAALLCREEFLRRFPQLPDGRWKLGEVHFLASHVLALVSLPGFDPTLFGRGITANEYGALQSDIDRPLFNRALRGTYPPGSTIKPGIALAGPSAV